MLLGVAAAETSQITGTLLVFALLVMPAATAHRLTARPGLGHRARRCSSRSPSTWLGLAVAFYSPYPIGFWVTRSPSPVRPGPCSAAAAVARPAPARVPARRPLSAVLAARLAATFGHPFIQHALLAGTAIAVVCGLVGYFVVLRGQVFTGDALGHVAYTGALAALALGIDPRVGLFAATIVRGAALGAARAPRAAPTTS